MEYWNNGLADTALRMKDKEVRRKMEGKTDMSPK
jgi:hypothetical protein